MHRNLGPGLLPNAYESALCYELATQGISFQRQIEIPIVVDDVALEESGEVPILVDREVPVFCLSHDKTTAVHRATGLARLCQGGWKRGLILNFNVNSMVDGVTRIIN